MFFNCLYGRDNIAQIWLNLKVSAVSSILFVPIEKIYSNLCSVQPSINSVVVSRSGMRALVSETDSEGITLLDEGLPGLVIKRQTIINR